MKHQTSIKLKNIENKQIDSSLVIASTLHMEMRIKRILDLFLYRLADVDVDVVDLRAQADASMPASNNNVKLYNISNF